MIYFTTVMYSHESRLLFILIFYVSFACLKIEANPTKVPTKLFIGRVAYNSPEMVLVSHEPLARYLQKTLNLEDVEFKLYLDYEQVYDALKRV